MTELEKLLLQRIAENMCTLATVARKANAPVYISYIELEIAASILDDIRLGQIGQ